MRTSARKPYLCKHCGKTGKKNFTRRLLFECRHCRAGRARDASFLEFKQAVVDQKLVNKHWIIGKDLGPSADTERSQ